MNKYFITGLSGVGKSSVICELNKRGYKAIDLDYGYTIESNYGEIIINIEKLTKEIKRIGDEVLFVSGCYSNQGSLYKYFDRVVLLECDLDVMLKRIDTRMTNLYGKTALERKLVIESFEEVLPMLRKGSDIQIRTDQFSIDTIVNKLIELIE